MRKLSLLAAALACLVVGAIAAPQAAPPDQPDGLAKPQNHKYGVDQAKTVALQSIDGTVVGDPVFKYDGGYWVYIVRVQTKKDVRRVWVDADTCRVVGIDTETSKKGSTSSAVKNLKKKLDRPKKTAKKHHTKKSRRPRIIIIRH